MKKSLVESIQNNLNEDENNEELLEQMANWLRNNFQEAWGLVRAMNSYDGAFEDLDYWENGEDFFQTFYANNIDEAVRAVCYGEYNYNDEYVRINAYGNLESANESDIEDEISYWAADIIDKLIDGYENYEEYIPEELKAMLQQHLATRPGPSEEGESNE